MSISNTRNADTAAIAVEFNRVGKAATVESVVAWTVRGIAMVNSWDGVDLPKVKGKTATDIACNRLRETYGYHVNMDGTPKLNDAGKRVPDSSVYRRIGLISGLIKYALKNQPDWIATLHAGATDPESSPEERDASVETAIRDYAATLIAASGGDTSIESLESLIKPKAKKVAPKDNLTSESESESESESAPKIDKGKTMAESPSIGFGDIITALMGMELTPVNLDSLESLITARRAEIAEQEAESAPIAANG